MPSTSILCYRTSPTLVYLCRFFSHRFIACLSTCKTTTSLTLNNLVHHYNSLYENAVQKIAAGHAEIDPLIDDASDARRGLTLLIRRSETVKNRIREFLDELALTAPGQYLYPASDMHITVMAVITAVPGFQLQEIQPEAYKALISASLAGLAPFQMDFRGLTASPAGVLVQGFPAARTLDDIRDRLREVFKTSTLRQSLDARYPIQTAHITVARLRQPLADVNAYLDVIEKYRTVDFGTMQVQELELVYNDWYQRAVHTQRLAQFQLGTPGNRKTL